MSPITATKKAIETRIATLGIPVAYENASFTPTAGQKYLIVQIVPRGTDDPTIGDVYHRELTEVQVFVCDKLNIGTASAIETAEQVRGLFPKGTTLVQDGFSIHVFSTPQIKGAAKTNDRLVVPVIIDFNTEVYS